MDNGVLSGVAGEVGQWDGVGMCAMERGHTWGSPLLQLLTSRGAYWYSPTAASALARVGGSGESPQACRAGTTPASPAPLHTLKPSLSQETGT